VTIASYIRVLRRRFVVLLVCLIAGATGAALYVAGTPKEYRATATYFVQLPSTIETTQQATQGLLVASDYLTSFQKLASKRAMAEQVATATGLPLSEVDGHLSSSVEPNTFFVDIAAVARDPSRAQLLANAALGVISTEVTTIQGSTGQAVRANPAQRADVPTVPFQPRPKLSVAVGIVLGVVVGLALIALIEALDRSTRGPDQTSELAGAPLLGTVPKRRGASAHRLVAADTDTEPYRALRTAVRFLDPDSPPQVLLITSAEPGDGKTTTASNLAIALASTGQTTVLVDADLRRAQISRTLGHGKAIGLTEVITRQASLADAVTAQGAVHVLPAGTLPPNPSEILGSQAMASILDQLRESFDAVVVDTPPVLVVTDGVVLAPQADAIVLVARHGKTARAAIVETVRRLEAVGAAPSGVVLNALPRSESGGYQGEYVYAPPRRLVFRRDR
jgi:capsular exopolysaccharide synthesis family protein